MELNKIWNMDCLEGMKMIPDKSIDCIICDLPYGVLNKTAEGGSWDSVIPFEPLWAQYKRVIKDNGAIVLFAQGMFTAQLMMSQPKLWRYNLIWDKKDRPTGFLDAKRRPLRIHEDILVFYQELPTYNPQFTKGNECHHRGGCGNYEKGAKNRCYGKMKYVEETITTEKYPVSIIAMDKEHTGDEWHPTQKPVDLIRYLVRTYSNEGETILDNCSGSGTTAIACIKERRNFICFEKDPTYWRKSVERVKNEMRQLTLF